ncbi:hypothetical protein WDW37_00010 [Bdellovibrionota bacterium FG-1]
MQKHLAKAPYWLPLVGLVCATANAAPIPALSQWMRQELLVVPAAAQTCALENAVGSNGWEFDAFYLDINPYLGFGVSGFFQIQVMPEVQFIWTTSDE